jgi:hypothetical protein
VQHISFGGGGRIKKEKKQNPVISMHRWRNSYLGVWDGWGETPKLLRVEKTQGMVVLLKIDGAFYFAHVSLYWLFCSHNQFSLINCSLPETETAI